MDRLFRHSSLYRPKWDEVHDAEGQTYGRRTIAYAINSIGYRRQDQQSGGLNALNVTEIDAGNHDSAIISSMAWDALAPTILLTCFFMVMLQSGWKAMMKGAQSSVR